MELLVILQKKLITPHINLPGNEKWRTPVHEDAGSIRWNEELLFFVYGEGARVPTVAIATPEDHTYPLYAKRRSYRAMLRGGDQKALRAITEHIFYPIVRPLVDMAGFLNQTTLHCGPNKTLVGMFDPKAVEATFTAEGNLTPAAEKREFISLVVSTYQVP